MKSFKRTKKFYAFCALHTCFFMFFHLEGRKTACRNVSNIFWMVGDGEAMHIR